MPRFDEMEDRDIYPAGDLPPAEDVDDVDAGYAEEPEPSVQEPADEPAKAQDWEMRYKQLEKKLGEQGNELGTMRQQNQELQNALQQMQQSQTPAAQEQAQDLQSQLQGIRAKLDEGDLSPDEALFETAQIVAQMSRMEAEQIADQRLQKFQQDSEADRVLSRFHEQYPDFEELRQNGVLGEVKKQLPGLHDDFSAYFEYKAKTSADEAYERGKKEMEKLAQGDAAAGKVLSKPGNTIRQKNQQPLSSPRDVKSSMADALKRARGG